MEKMTKVILLLIFIALPLSYASGDFAYNRLCNIAEPLDVSIVDPLDGETIPVISKEHLEMHEGDHYFIKTWVENTGAAETADYFSFCTPNTTTRVHAKAILFADTDTVFNIYENSTIETGVIITGFNNDRDSNNTAELVAYAVPTIIDNGNLIWTARSGGGRDAVGIALGLDYEIIAKTDACYTFEVEKQTSANTVVDVNFFWYEEAEHHS